MALFDSSDRRFFAEATAPGWGRADRMRGSKAASEPSPLMVWGGITAFTQAATTVPTGTAITVTIDQSISSKDAKVGQGVVATVSHDVTENGRVLIPKGAHAKLVVTSVQASGRLSTPAKLYLRLKSVEVHGKTIEIATNSAGRTMGGKGKRDAEVTRREAGIEVREQGRYREVKHPSQQVDVDVGAKDRSGAQRRRRLSHAFDACRDGLAHARRQVGRGGVG